MTINYWIPNADTQDIQKSWYISCEINCNISNSVDADTCFSSLKIIFLIYLSKSNNELFKWSKVVQGQVYLDLRDCYSSLCGLGRPVFPCSSMFPYSFSAVQDFHTSSNWMCFRWLYPKYIDLHFSKCHHLSFFSKDDLNHSFFVQHLTFMSTCNSFPSWFL